MFWRHWSQCLICQRWPTLSVCPDCHERHARIEPRCASCAQILSGHAGQCDELFSWDQASARVNYSAPFDGWVKRLKFTGEWTLAREMAQLMRECPSTQALLDAADWVLPVPVSPQRLRERGYNQAAWLARQWCGRERRLQVHWLQKVQHTTAQARADRATRWQHLQGTMGLRPEAVRRVRGTRVLLIDDVMTTGATLEVATELLRQAGARQVDVAVFARTPLALHSGDHV
jgi:ComF family protein